jgi:hypothetical protein
MISLEILMSIDIDTHCPVTTVHNFVVLDDTEPYVCTLNQADVVNNCNKSYLMQLLGRAGETYVIYSRFGRVGQVGTMNTDIFVDKEAAIIGFTRLFKEKTGVNWKDRYTDTGLHLGKYQFIIMKHDNVNTLKTTEPKVAAKITLSKAVQSFIKLIYDPSLYDAAAAGFNVDTRKLPLGSLGKMQIEKAQSILNQISALIGKSDVSATDKINQLSSLFYTSIPSAQSKLRPINTVADVSDKSDLLDLLSNLCYMSKGVDKDVMERYSKLETNLSHVTDPETLDIIHRYMNSNVGATHKMLLKVQSVYEIDKPKEKQSYRKWDSLHNKQLLWHGTRLANAVGILTTGFRINPVGVPTTGKMFGNGLYFANSSTKSAGYLGMYQKGQGIMFLCEIALGNMYDRIQGEHIISLPYGKNSTRGVGRVRPDPLSHVDMDDVTVPIGNLVDSGIAGCALQYDEFIVYDTSQIRMRYAVIVEYNPTW